MAEVQVPSHVVQAVALIGKHPGVQGVRISPNKLAADGVLVEVDLRVELPSRSTVNGESVNGVRSIETAMLWFSADYPVLAPAIALRDGFDRSLPHINPGFPTGPVIPCVYDGDLNDLLQRGGIWAIIDQLCTWLDKAATGALIDPHQGWEPIRRDDLRDCIVARASEFQQYGESDGPPFRAFYELDFILFPKPDTGSAQRRCFYGTVGKSIGAGNLLDRCNSRDYPTHSSGHSIAIAIRPNKIDGKRRIANRYFPETVKTAEDLASAAEQYGCGRGLEEVFALLRYQLQRAQEKVTLPVVIVFCANRPFKAIGSGSSIELVPYVTQLKASFDKSTAVFPVAHRDAVDSELLRRLSGSERDDKSFLHWTQLGCGSLGSKIAVHLTRAGYGPTCLVDKANLMPHHAARHALLPSQEGGGNNWWGSKTDALSKVLAGFGQRSPGVTQDIRALSPGTKAYREVFAKNLWAAINSTASLSVREWLSSLSSHTLSARIIETCLYGSGRVGSLTVEGPNRNPNSCDLAAYTHLLFSQTKRLRNMTLVEESGVARRLVGQGCGSPTMIISDMRVSIFAASMAQYVNLLQRTHLPTDTGTILIGTIAQDELGLVWQVENVLATDIFKVDNAKDWTVRVLPTARTKIEEDCKRYPGVETGGVVAGLLSYAQRALVIADIIPAPEDSSRSAARFVLGTKGLRRALEEYAELTGGSLYCVGTWHSHLVEQGPSPTDYATAKVIADLRPFPSAMLVKTPSQYRALVTNVG